MKQTGKQKIFEFLRYILIGFTTTFINWGINILFTEVIRLNATVAVIIAWIVSTIFFAFWAYKFFVFRSKSMEAKLIWSEFAGFTSARLLTLGVETAITFLFCSVLHFDSILRIDLTRVVDGADSGTFDISIRERYIVKLFACVIVTILNYVFSKLIIFKKGQKKTLEESAPDTMETEN